MFDVDVCGSFTEQDVRAMLKDLYGLEKNEHGLRKLLVLIAFNEDAESKAARLCEHDIIIINGDSKDIRTLLKNSTAIVITYGLSNKACITASSVVEEDHTKVSCCIQRKIPTLSGKEIEEQEFTVHIAKPCKNLSSALACVTAALVCDIGIQAITDTRIK